MKSDKILVVGNAGSLAARVINELSEKGVEVASLEQEEKFTESFKIVPRPKLELFPDNTKKGEHDGAHQYVEHKTQEGNIICLQWICRLCDRKL